jgi:hypothetical protein
VDSAADTSSCATVRRHFSVDSYLKCDCTECVHFMRSLHTPSPHLRRLARSLTLLWIELHSTKRVRRHPSISTIFGRAIFVRRCNSHLEMFTQECDSLLFLSICIECSN